MIYHVHILASLPATISVSKMVQLLKGNSSKWIHETFLEMRSFEWQQGYGAFSIGVSAVDATIAYIRNQTEHHRKRTFRGELKACCASTASTLMNLRSTEILSVLLGLAR